MIDFPFHHSIPYSSPVIRNTRLKQHLGKLLCLWKRAVTNHWNGLLEWTLEAIECTTGNGSYHSMELPKIFLLKYTTYDIIDKLVHLRMHYTFLASYLTRAPVRAGMRLKLICNTILTLVLMTLCHFFTFMSMWLYNYNGLDGSILVRLLHIFTSNCFYLQHCY